MSTTASVAELVSGSSTAGTGTTSGAGTGAGTAETTGVLSREMRPGLRGKDPKKNSKFKVSSSKLAWLWKMDENCQFIDYLPIKIIEKCECRKFEGNHEKSWVENYGEVCPLCLVCFIRSGHVAPWSSKTLPRWHVKKYASKHPSSFVFLIASQLSKLNPKSWYFQFQGHSKYRIGEISRPIYLSIYLSIHPSIHRSI